MKTVDRQREALKSAYSSKMWIEKVKKMSDAQVQAIFLRLKSQNKV